jgi:hypothetical protein
MPGDCGLVIECTAKRKPEKKKKKSRQAVMELRHQPATMCWLGSKHCGRHSFHFISFLSFPLLSAGLALPYPTSYHHHVDNKLYFILTLLSKK